MLIGVPKEIKVHEYRVGMTPSSVREAVAHGHQVLVETNAGAGIGASDEDYRRAGARVAAGADEVFARAELIVKVKEPQAVERARLREGQVLFTYLHLAPDPEQTADILEQIDTTLREAGTDKTRILRANIWLTDIQTWAEMNEAWDAWVVPGQAPARATAASRVRP
jgi:alanine dehydrogenase